MKDIINVAVVAYEPTWGSKEKNLERISGYAECAARRGAHLIVLPETALTGYDLEVDCAEGEEMHHRLAEPVPGPSSLALAEVAKKNDIYIVYGLAERGEDGTVYNAAAAVGPEGVIGSYRKMHLPFDEKVWAERGDYPFMFDTPWGKIGISICYDTFVFPEIMRYYAANGCRMVLNPCAVDTNVTAKNVRESVEFSACNNAIFIASANCTGFHSRNNLVGGSNIIGPGKNAPETHYYAGSAFGTPGSDEQEMYIGTLDLNYVGKSWHALQWDEETPDFRVDRYLKMYEEVATLPKYNK